MNGWIKIHRKILDNRVVCKDADHMAVWMYLLLNASHNAHSQLYGGKTVELRPGQLITGRRVIGERLSIDEMKVWRILKLFQKNKQISIEAKNTGSLISILAWNEYQSERMFEQQNEQRNEQQSERQVKSENADKIKVFGNKEQMFEQRNAQQNAQQSEHNQEGFNKNNIKKKTVPLGTAKEKDFFCDPELNAVFVEFIKFRKQIRSPMTDRAIELAVNKLNKLSPDPLVQRQIIEQSIVNGWKGLFQLQDDEPRRKWKQQSDDKFAAITQFLNGGEDD